MTVNGSPVHHPIIKHEDLFTKDAIEIVFEMSEKVEQWGNEVEVLEALGLQAAWMDIRLGGEDRIVGRADDL